MIHWTCCVQTLAKFPEYLERRSQSFEGGIPPNVRLLVLHVLAKCVRYGARQVFAHYATLSFELGIHRDTLSKKTVPQATAMGLLEFFEPLGNRSPMVLRVAKPHREFWPVYSEEEQGRMLERVLNQVEEDFFYGESTNWQGGLFVPGIES